MPGEIVDDARAAKLQWISVSEFVHFAVYLRELLADRTDRKARERALIAEMKEAHDARKAALRVLGKVAIQLRPGSVNSDDDLIACACCVVQERDAAVRRAEEAEAKLAAVQRNGVMRGWT